ncbi:MAG: hypothetical protein KME60_21665 [Cyanomargarita calcarea GSE-NOS-MK-12-04C]|jgi:hypothetical protein|uniref:Uncharacterized protein n=1 Tax=Cyanomargarita calcarea GSE-NOS-MK-12-04C TaxID=2839659 RepID=A0A951QQU3_9CYAN|nr:hypothetical protein [Cyanomargarita calcarea GSE-NOS-MK-12-04C]
MNFVDDASLSSNAKYMGIMRTVIVGAERYPILEAITATGSRGMGQINLHFAPRKGALVETARGISDYRDLI